MAMVTIDKSKLNGVEAWQMVIIIIECLVSIKFFELLVGIILN